MSIAVDENPRLLIYWRIHPRSVGTGLFDIQPLSGLYWYIYFQTVGWNPRLFRL